MARTTDGRKGTGALRALKLPAVELTQVLHQIRSNLLLIKEELVRGLNLVGRGSRSLDPAGMGMRVIKSNVNTKYHDPIPKRVKSDYEKTWLDLLGISWRTKAIVMDRPPRDERVGGRECPCELDFATGLT